MLRVSSTVDAVERSLREQIVDRGVQVARHRTTCVVPSPVLPRRPPWVEPASDALFSGIASCDDGWRVGRWPTMAAARGRTRVDAVVWSTARRVTGAVSGGAARARGEA
jgi:hypothetical protein